VKTGSNNDPSDNTGLAHYLEHMMFKGTSKLGTLDWQKEKVLWSKFQICTKSIKRSKILKKERNLQKNR
jgi:predicted Zn-dependent peptidase